MHFCFYPKHDYGCPHVMHCPHLGGAALGTLVHAADEQTEWMDALQRQVDSLRAENTAKYDKIEELTARIEQLERELKAERQKQFKAKKEEPTEADPSEPVQGQKKRGRRWGIRAGIVSGPSSSISWFSFQRRVSAHAAAARSRLGRTASRTITFKKIGSTVSGW